MIFDTNKIDTAYFDKWKKTITMIIYDTHESLNESDLLEHNCMIQKKIEAYLKFIENGGMLNYFHLNASKKYRYIIKISLNYEPVEEYLNFLKLLDSDISLRTNNMVRLSNS